jgi:hypothetical protein
LTKLGLKDNAMLTEAAGRAVGSALVRNSVLTELDISDQAGYRHGDGPGFAKELAVGISDNGTVSSLNVSNNMMRGAGTKQIAKLLSKCEDGKPFRSKGIFASLVCKHTADRRRTDILPGLW